MSDPHRPAIAGGTPVRLSRLPYGRHQLSDADVDAVVATLRSGSLTGGAAVRNFEAALAECCGVAYAVACSSGTAALHLAMTAVGVRLGDEVITTPLTFVATANAAIYCGAEPVFADIGVDRCLDPDSVASRVTLRTRAVVTVDYAGLPGDTPHVRSRLPAALPVIVDGAHSLGALLAGRPTGAVGDVTTLSFHPVKHITTGEGGACLTNDPDMAACMRRMRNHGMTSTASERSGREWRYDVLSVGHNYRMTDIQAALGTSQLRRLDSVVERRRWLADRYDQLLSNIDGITLPPRPPGRQSAWHLYAVEIDAGQFGATRDDVVEALRAENIEATVHYPAVHLLSLYRDRGHHEGEAPAAEAVCSRLLTLPLFPNLTEQDQDDVVTALRRIQAWTRGVMVARA